MLIESPSNPTVKLLRSLDVPRNIKAEGLFLVEGVRALDDGLDSGQVPHIILYSSDLLRRTDRGRKLLARIESMTRQDSGTHVAGATERVLEAAANTQHPQGVIAAFPIIDRPGLEAVAASEHGFLGLVCDNIQDPGNLGTMLRTAEAAGVKCVWLSPDCAYPYAPKVVRAATGAHFRLPLYPDTEWPDLAEVLKGAVLLSGRVFATEAQSSVPYDEVDWSLPSVLIVSNEAHGMSREAANLLRSFNGSAVSIPMLGGTESLNASIAAAVILFEAARQRRTRTARLK